MTIVLDANLIVSLVLALPYSEAATHQIIAWKRQGKTLAAPTLWTYEVCSVLRKAEVTGYLDADQINNALIQLWRINIQGIPATLDLQRQALIWAERLGQSKAHDGAYLAVAESLGSEFWTADRRLAQSAHQSGASWVYSIVESSR